MLLQTTKSNNKNYCEALSLQSAIVIQLPRLRVNRCKGIISNIACSTWHETKKC